MKKLNKKIFFRLSVVISGVTGLFFATQHKDTLIDLTASILDNPIIGIEKVYAEDGCSGCSGSACEGSVTFPSPVASGVQIKAVEI